MPSEATYDCQVCGACCVQLGAYDGSAYVYLDRNEASLMRSYGLPVIRSALGGSCLGARPHEGHDGRPACVAFTGKLGEWCGCSVYEDRPSVCREYENGGHLCREARQRAGLTV